MRGVCCSVEIGITHGCLPLQHAKTEQSPSSPTAGPAAPASRVAPQSTNVGVPGIPRHRWYRGPARDTGEPIHPGRCRPRRPCAHSAAAPRLGRQRCHSHSLCATLGGPSHAARSRALRERSRQRPAPVWISCRRSRSSRFDTRLAAFLVEGTRLQEGSAACRAANRFGILSVLKRERRVVRNPRTANNALDHWQAATAHGSTFLSAIPRSTTAVLHPW